MTIMKLSILLFVVGFANAAATRNEEEKRAKRMNLWKRGAFAFDVDCVDSSSDANCTSTTLGMHRLGAVRRVRQRTAGDCLEWECHDSMRATFLVPRGGASCSNNNSTAAADTGTNYGLRLERKLRSLGDKFGQDFTEAIERNKREHAQDCDESCKFFYCANNSTSSASTNDDSSNNKTTFVSYSFGATPPEDFGEEFGFPFDLIKVSQSYPLFSKQEAMDVIQLAEEEGVDKNEYKSGKYKLGGDWLLNLPKTRAWFNDRLETTFFPLLARLFPEIVSSPQVLRAHSVSLLKYNSSHPRTDVHIDNGILAMTLAMTPMNDYTGGGTFFEHMGVDHVLPMDVGHGTFRPGSIRHGGHRVSSGTRYVLGAFLLIEDRVEHVRRLKNRGSALRREGNLAEAERHFEWALAINPLCTTCLKDWAEILLTQKKFDRAEEKIRRVLDLLEELDSDALFTLGLLLSEQGKDDESIAAYTKSVQLNAEDAELCYNLGIKLGAKGEKQAEMTMYARATTIDPKMGGAWVNWGTTLAESGSYDDAEVMFLKGTSCPEVAPKAMMNLAILYQRKANELATNGYLLEAKHVITNAAKYLDDAKPLLDHAMDTGIGGAVEDNEQFAKSFEPLRLQCHRLTGSLLAGLDDYAGCEEEFVTATKRFPTSRVAWEMLARVLELRGKAEEAKLAQDTIRTLLQ